MADGDPTKWSYFEQMNVVQFLQQVQYFNDKQKELERQRKLMSKK